MLVDFRSSKMKIVFAADQHGELCDPSKLDGDVLILGGDLCPDFINNPIANGDVQKNWFVQDFIPWAEKIKTDQILIGVGNHDFAFDYFLREVNEYLEYHPKIKILIDKSIIIGGTNFYFTPWVPYLKNYVYSAAPEKMQLLRDMIPENIRVLVSHAPPYGILDDPQHYGCKQLKERIKQLTEIELVLCGHCHADGGKQITKDGIVYANAARTIFKFDIYE